MTAICIHAVDGESHVGSLIFEAALLQTVLETSVVGHFFRSVRAHSRNRWLTV